MWSVPIGDLLTLCINKYVILQGTGFKNLTSHLWLSNNYLHNYTTLNVMFSQNSVDGFFALVSMAARSHGGLILVLFWRSCCIISKSIIWSINENNSLQFAALRVHGCGAGYGASKLAISFYSNLFSWRAIRVLIHGLHKLLHDPKSHGSRCTAKSVL